MATAVTNWRGKTKVERYNKADEYVIKMTGNALIPTPPTTPTIAQMTTLSTDARAKDVAARNARNAAKQLTAASEAADKALEDAANNWLRFVQTESGGDAAVILSVGFDVKAAPTTIALVMPENFAATTGDNDGELDVQCDRVKGAELYDVEMSLTPNGPWELKLSVGESRGTIAGLTSGTKYYLRMRAGRGQEKGPWSDISARIAP